MSYAAFSQEKTSRALFRRSGAGTGRQGPWTFGRRRIAHPASIALFLIFCNHLLSDPSRFGRPDPKRVLQRKRRRLLAPGEKLVIIGVGDQVAILAVGETGALHCH